MKELEWARRVRQRVPGKEQFTQWSNDEKSLVNKNREKTTVIAAEGPGRGRVRLIRETGPDLIPREDFSSLSRRRKSH